MIQGNRTSSRRVARTADDGVNLTEALSMECCIPDCWESSYEGAPLPVCARHYLIIVRDFQAQTYGIEWAESSPPPPRPRVEYVYFIRFRDAVKIGLTTDVPRRLKELPWDEVLAVVPGSRQIEGDWHARFAGQRITGEWFTLTDELSAAIKDVA